MNAVRASARLLRAVVHGLAGLCTIVFLFPRLGGAAREERVRAWAWGMLRIFGVSVKVVGQPPVRGPMLLVANHISWLDILVIHAARHCRFVSKADVRRWPLVGTLATGAGTLYVERESRRDAMRVVHQMAERLRQGDILAVFPEGTTSDGTTLLPFHGNLLQAAISAGVPAQPVALSFLDAQTRAPSFAPLYIGDDTLLESVWRTLTSPPIEAVIAFGEPRGADGRDRRAWAGDLRQVVLELRDVAVR